MKLFNVKFVYKENFSAFCTAVLRKIIGHQLI